MDVCRWLEETKTLGPPASLGLPAGQHARERAPRDAAERSSHHKCKRKRPQKQSSSDSSLLQLDRTNGHQKPVTQSTGNGDRARQRTASDKPAGCCSSELPGSADRSESERYSRRRRRRTRPEIYEPKPDKKQSKPNRRSRKDRNVPTKHKDRRRTGYRQPDPPHTFHAKNVGRDRLTLKPKEGLGLFRKGRASSPVKGRGLPDLVFSEMRFLQKRSGPKDSQSAEEAPRKRRKNSNAVGQEDEISTYFAAKPPGLAERDINIPARGVQDQLSKSDGCKFHPSSSSDNRTLLNPPIDLPEKPYLGFGTRGVNPPTGSDSSSYIPCSETDQHMNVAAFQRCSGQSPSLQKVYKGQHKAQGGISAGLAHRRTLHDIPSEMPFGSENGRHTRLDGGDTGSDVAAFFQQKAKDTQRFPPDFPQIKTLIPPSSHKHRSERNAHEFARQARRLLSTQERDYSPGTDINEQQEKQTNHVEKGSQVHGAFAEGPSIHAAQNGHVEMAQDAIDGTTDATEMRAPLRSSSPLGKLLRQCDNACHDPQPAQSAPMEKQYSNRDMEYLEKPVEIYYAASQAKAHRTSVPPCWARRGAPNRPGLYQVQTPHAAMSDGHGGGYAAVENVNVPDMARIAINDEEGDYEDDLAGAYLHRDRSEGYVDMGFDSAEGSFGGSVNNFGRQGGQEAGRRSDETEFGGVLMGFWRPHKLY